MFKIESLELTKMIALHRYFPREIEKGLGSFIRGSGEDIKDIAMTESPSGTGKLKKSIVHTYRPFVSEIYPKKKYAIYVEKGTGLYGPFRRKIVPVSKKALRFEYKGRIVFAKSVKGMKPNPFMARTAKRAESVVIKKGKETLRNLARKLTI